MDMVFLINGDVTMSHRHFAITDNPMAVKLSSLLKNYLEIFQCHKQTLGVSCKPLQPHSHIRTSRD